MERMTTLSPVLTLTGRGLSPAAIERKAAELVNSRQVTLVGNQGQDAPMIAFKHA